MTELMFHGPARAAALWLLTETGLDRHPNLSTFAAADPFTVVLDDWYDASHNEQAVLDTLWVLSTRRYLLDVVSLSQADAQTRRVCLYAVGMALDVLLVPPVVEVTA